MTEKEGFLIKNKRHSGRDMIVSKIFFKYYQFTHFWKKEVKPRWKVLVKMLPNLLKFEVFHKKNFIGFLKHKLIANFGAYLVTQLFIMFHKKKINYFF